MTINAQLDENSRPTLTAVSSADGSTIVRVYADPVTHRLLVQSSGGSGGTGTWYNVTGTIDGSNKTFTIPVAVTSDFLLVLANQTQQQNVGVSTYDYSYVAGVSTTTITYTVAPPGVLSGSAHTALVIS